MDEWTPVDGWTKFVLEGLILASNNDASITYNSKIFVNSRKNVRSTFSTFKLYFLKM